MKGLLTPSPGAAGPGGVTSSSSSVSRHRFSEISQRSSRHPSPTDGQRPNQNFAVVVSAKPRYVPKTDVRPQVTSAPYQTINAPFRISRKILSKEVSDGGSVIYRLGALLPSGNSVHNAVTDIIQVSATNIDDYVSYEELERFEHEDFELELARENEANEKSERRQTRDLLHGSFKKARGRPKKHKGLLSPLFYRRGRFLGHADSDDDRDSGETESETSSTDVEERASSSRWKPLASTITEGRRNTQVRIEIPIRPSEKQRTISRPVLEGNKPKVDVVQNLLELTDDSKSGLFKGNAPSSDGSFKTASGSTRDREKVVIQSDKGFLSRETKNHQSAPVASLVAPKRITIDSFTSTTTKAVSKGSGIGQPQQKAAFRIHQTPIDEPKSAPVHVQNISSNKSFNTVVIRDGKGDDGDEENFVQPPQIPRSQQSTRHETGERPRKVILPLSGRKSIKKENVEFIGDADSNDEADIFISRPSPTTINSNQNVAQSPFQDNTPRHDSLKASNSAPVSRLGSVELLDQAIALPDLPLSHSLKKPKSSLAVVADTDSEDDLAAGDQLLQEFEGEKVKAIETADSLLRRFQKQPLKHHHLPPSPLKSSVPKKPSKPSSNYKDLMMHSSTRRKPSMTSPFPSGKPIRRSIPPSTKENPQTGATKTLVPQGESENDSSTKKRKRDKFIGRGRAIRPFDDPEADWSPKR